MNQINSSFILHPSSLSGRSPGYRTARTRGSNLIMRSLNAKQASNKYAAAPRHAWQRPLLSALLALTAGMAFSARPSQADELAGKGDLFLSRQAARHQKQGWTAVIIKLNADLTPEQENL